MSRLSTGRDTEGKHRGKRKNQSKGHVDVVDSKTLQFKLGQTLLELKAASFNITSSYCTSILSINLLAILLIRVGANPG